MRQSMGNKSIEQTAYSKANSSHHEGPAQEQ